MRFGGGFGLSFGEITNITLSPNAIYYFNSYVGTGVGLNGIYASEKDVYKATVLGGSLIGVFNPIREIQLSSEFEMLNVNRDFETIFENAGFEDEKYWYPALFFGIGYNPGFMTIGLRYDVLYDETKSIYGNAFMPFIRLSF
ncbi:MAG: alpha-ketoglutarate decarboxylase [Sinomicrobium sp.]|nr:alpha-ketoglutarate decarboxylase [Sinomicrobium sp.]